MLLNFLVHFSSLHLWICSRRTPRPEKHALHLNQPDRFRSYTLHPPLLLSSMKPLLAYFNQVTLSYLLLDVRDVNNSAFSHFLITSSLCVSFPPINQFLNSKNCPYKTCKLSYMQYLDLSKNKKLSVSTKSILV